ncbi:TIGR03752 family integrating conjugative element protein [Salmonella enterica]|uniref:TIGR03752 family integrating conjugative element protein n=1 Tax=Salmonella enterica TaxID=28901 RepID=A0A5Y5E8P2_SALER|nr:TIGR03752 family integrating conjugative element protein [Salmonella enterica]EEE1584764.1 TIGR03752 family integrating conjugative element protein [Salmonella enterica subsp. enterica serovar Oranienburg]EEN2379718.1 TIGR03752 family integrating conjugative element protein [Salmonella enterica subsp. enterica serovar Infantis]EAP6143391.1 TIGR03752 family integrating conjugative element protein [Salmonella enterica]EAU8847406.1 TIGR03752 family integrating conjugative element protein [Salmo
MATLRSNTLVKIIIPVVALGAVAIGIRACSDKRVQQEAAVTTLPTLTPEQLRELGVEGDTAQDTLNTLVGKLGEIQRQQGDILEENKQLKEENKTLQASTSQVDKRIDEAVSDAQEKTQRALETQKKSLTETFDSMLAGLQGGSAQVQTNTSGTGNMNGSDIPVGLGLDAGGTGQVSGDGYQWVEPQDAVPVDPQNSQSGPPRFATSFLDDNALTRQKNELERNANNRQGLNNEQDEGLVDPVYTLPENSTLVGSTAMTALLGRIPVNNKVTDPYPFKVMIGRDNLTANGIELPDVEGVIVSGTASGDWTLSCVRGDVKSITFVFSDGTVRTVPAPSGRTGNSGSDNGGTSGNGGSIGWLSDDNGIPCISGTLKSNASTYLPTIGLLGLGTSAGDALTANQYTSNTTDGGGITSALTGNAGQAVLGQALGGGFKEVAQWVKERYAQTFDAVYVPPGAKVAVHITRQLNIDYAEKGRRVKYDFTLPGTGTTQQGLD